ncbi:putative spermidine/putrescine transport system ATP-binding protein [Rhodopseudomonas julia]|uniref:Spermidine/putrescine transport system ATP-binding protein n=1 Tax=Rhodopseudomonas julia TaxID=200617 RepID=A0ABU0C1R7_9BRAD|nr:ABC transporter ATP-binding protein [Rhodopseudomonas julia]MDQ0324167.1 putative spermidine/putrescine transport system ATP-binding protein [Rhodopseudomonas julia]
MAEEFLSLEAITKTFGTNTVIEDLDLSFNSGEFVSLLGPSGCGKTTVLRMIAGFEKPTKGRIFADGREITHLKPSQRNVGMVFQSYALFPNLNVRDNIGFGLKVAGVPRAKARERVAEMLELIGLPDLGRRYAFELSGGQQQRVALARALAPSPRMLLLDEPLSALDAKIRVSLREQIRNIQRELGITTIFVTHDQEEALSISDRIVVMNSGRIEQVGAPFEVYNRPATPFVANFVGTLNRVEARVKNAASQEVAIGEQSVVLKKLPATVRDGEPVVLALRPEALNLVNGADNGICLNARVETVSFLGSVIRIGVAVGDTHLHVDLFNDRRSAPPQPGETLRVGFKDEDVISVTA